MQDDTETWRIETARVAWEGGAPRSARFDDIYFSGEGLGETEHVFLAGNDLPRRFAAASRFAVGELGFGTGLNFLMTWELWRRRAPASARLVYVSVEGFPLSTDDMARAHGAWDRLAGLSERLRAALPPSVAGVHALEITDDVRLILAYGEAEDALACAEGAIDAWFFDGFSPAKNPKMWRPGLFREAARLSRPGATFATYTVAGEVRRAIEAAGFRTEKRPGFGRKKEMLAGGIDTPPLASRRAPWFQTREPRVLSPGARLAIIGGGIAGASLASAARRAGLVPTIIEREGIAAGASGNPAGLIMPRLDLGEGPTSRFFVLAYLHVLRALTPALFNRCGVVLGAEDGDERRRLAKIAAAGLLPDGWIEPRAEGLFLPQAGVVDPARFVRALLGETETLKADARALSRDGDKLRIETDGAPIEGFDAVVLANGAGALKFLEARSLPLSAVAGQIDWFPGALAPPAALAFGPYAAPAPQGGMVIGATYAPSGEAAAASRAATTANMEAVRAFAPALVEGLDPQRALPRASLRCQTPDRLPVAGPLPDLGFYGAAYDELRLGVRKAYPPGEITGGVYALTGLGSRGLVTAPLAAAMLVAEMTGAPSPVDSEIAEILHPARFFIRDLKRARTVRRR